LGTEKTIQNNWFIKERLFIGHLQLVINIQVYTNNSNRGKLLKKKIEGGCRRTYRKHNKIRKVLTEGTHIKEFKIKFQNLKQKNN